MILRNRTTRRNLSTTALAALLLPATSFGDVPTKPAEIAKQAAEVQKLLSDLHRSATTPQQKQQDVDRLLDLGEEGPRRLAQQCQRDFSNRLSAYLSHFESAAPDALRAGWKG